MKLSIIDIENALSDSNLFMCIREEARKYVTRQGLRNLIKVMKATELDEIEL